MQNKNPLFPNGKEDLLVEIFDVKITTNFSHMGESDGIDITCSLLFETKYEEILMNPDWEKGIPTEKLKEIFPNGYFVFKSYKKEKVHYRFFADYDQMTEAFLLKVVKKKNEPHSYYLNSIHDRYTEEAVSQFEQQLFQKIVHTYIQKNPYD